MGAALQIIGYIGRLKKTRFRDLSVHQVQFALFHWLARHASKLQPGRDE